MLLKVRQSLGQCVCVCGGAATTMPQRLQRFLNMLASLFFFFFCFFSSHGKHEIALYVHKCKCVFGDAPVCVRVSVCVSELMCVCAKK